MSVVVGFIGLGCEFVKEGDDGIILALDEGRSILPDSIFCPPLAMSWVALILMDVVHPEVFGEGFSEYVQLFWLLQ